MRGVCAVWYQRPLVTLAPPVLLDLGPCRLMIAVCCCYIVGHRIFPRVRLVLLSPRGLFVYLLFGFFFSSCFSLSLSYSSLVSFPRVFVPITDMPPIICTTCISHSQSQRPSPLLVPVPFS
jgi:hypothetical protein